MSNTSLFNNGSTTTVDYEAEVKRKYSKEDGTLDYEKLFQGRVEADRFIDQLKEETKGLRNELNSRVTVEESLSKLLTRSTSNNNEPRVEERLPNNTPPINEPKQVTKDDLMSLVKEALETESSKAKKQANIEAAARELENVFGNNYAGHLQKKAQDLGVSVEFFDKLASESPKALLALVSERKAENNLSTPPQGSVTNAPGNGGKTYKYYQNLKKSDPKTYWSPAVQNEMYQYAAKLGPKFYD